MRQHLVRSERYVKVKVQRRSGSGWLTDLKRQRHNKEDPLLKKPPTLLEDRFTLDTDIASTFIARHL